MTDTVQQHRDQSPAVIRCAVITLSDTRTLETDTGGGLLCELLEAAGHVVARRELIPDDQATLSNLLNECEADDSIAAVLMTGGTGISSRDQTFETVTNLLTKPLPGYGELFRVASYEEIGAAAMLSRATGGLMNRTLLMTMPGSRNAVRLAMEKLILPELGHLIREANR